jgi:2,4-dienoyl-CoA reductase-like NADH-dependent reductase (Old Yellow Enzyme family)
MIMFIVSHESEKHKSSMLMRARPGFYVPHAAAIKGVVDVPVIGVGGIVTAEVADGIIRSGRVDLVAVGRAISVNRDGLLLLLES